MSLGAVRKTRTFKMLATSVVGLFLFFMSVPSALFALPQGYDVVSGNVSFNQVNSTTLNITASDNAIINYSSFNIGTGETVNFFQTSVNSALLNRVTGAGSSSILGNLYANGSIFLINPNGIQFGSQANVQVGSLVASTLDIHNEDFLAGKYKFFKKDGVQAGTIINEGRISAAPDGVIALMSPSVRNSGKITAQLGTVAMVSGEKVTMDFTGDGLVSFTIDEGVNATVMGPDGKPMKAQVENLGQILADGGVVLISAKAAQGVLDSMINQQGLVQARSVVERGGKIFLEGGDNTKVVNAGTLDASSAAAGVNGGDISMASGDIQNEGKIYANASNYSKAGSIKAIAAHQLTLESGSVIEAKGADVQSQGGQISLESGENTTLKAGQKIDVSGGTISGNAGSGQINAANKEELGGIFLANAQAGFKKGNFSFDPDSLIITSDAMFGDGVDATFWARGDVTLNSGVTITATTGNLLFLANHGTDGSEAVPGLSDWHNDAIGDLNILGTVITTTGNVFYYGQDVNISGTTTTGGGFVEVKANQNISQTGNVTTGGGVYNARADQDLNDSGSFAMGSNTTINTAGGDVYIEAGQDPNTAAVGGDLGIGEINAGSGNVYLVTGNGGVNDVNGSANNIVTTGSLNVLVQKAAAGTPEAIHLNTQIDGTLTAVSFGSGEIFIDNVGNLIIPDLGYAAVSSPDSVTINNVGNLTFQGQATMASLNNVTLTTTGDLALGTVGAMGDIAITSTTGAITDANGDTANAVFGQHTSFSAATGIGSNDALEVLTNNLAAQNTTSGNIQFRTPGTTVGSANGINGITNSGGGNVSITAEGGGSLTTNEEITVNDGGSMTALVEGDTTLNRNVTTQGGAVDFLNTQGNFTSNATVNSNGANITVLANNGAVSTGALSSGGGSINVSGKNQVSTSGIVNAGSGNVALTSTQGKIMGTSSGPDVIANNLTMSAQTGIGDYVPMQEGDAMIIDVDSLNASTQSGDIFLAVEDANNNLVVNNLATGGTSPTQDSIYVYAMGHGSPNNINIAGNITTQGAGVSVGGFNNVSVTNNAAITTNGGSFVSSANNQFNMTNGTSINTMRANQTSGGLIQIQGGNGVSVTGLKTMLGMATNPSSMYDGVVFLITPAGNITDAGDSLTDVVGQRVVMYSANGIGSGNSLETAIGQLSAKNTTSGEIGISNNTAGMNIERWDSNIPGVTNQGAGQVNISNTGNLTVSPNAVVQSTQGADIRLTSGGTASITGVSTAGNVFVTSTGGNGITKSGNNTTDVQANNLAIQSTNGVSGINTQVNKLAMAGGGNMSLSNSGNLEVADLSSIGGPTGITNSSDASKTVSVSTTGSMTQSANIATSGANVAMTADSNGATNGGYTMTPGTSISTGAGSIHVTAGKSSNQTGGGDIVLTQLSGGTGDAGMIDVQTYNGAITGQDNIANILSPGTVILLRAATGIGSANGINIDTTNASGTGLSLIEALNTSSGNIRINHVSNADDTMVIGEFPIGLGGPGWSEAFKNVGGGDIIITSSGGGSFQAGFDATPLGAGYFEGDITAMDGGSFTFTGSGAFTLNSLITTSGGNVTLMTAGDIHQHYDPTWANGSIATGGGQVNITTNGQYLMEDHTKVNAGLGAVNVISEGNMSVTGITGSDVKLVTHTGAINDAGETNTDVTANNLSMTASNGIGSGSSNGILETAVNNLAVKNNTSGAVNIRNTGDVTIADLSAIGGETGITNAASDPNVTNYFFSTGTVHQNANVVTGGSSFVAFADSDANGAGTEGYIMASGTSINTGAGSIVLVAGNPDTQTGGGDIVLGSLVGGNNPDGGVVNVMTQEGAIKGSSGTEITTHDGTMFLRAAKGIGADDAIDIDTTNASDAGLSLLQAINTQSGDLNIRHVSDSDDTLVIAQLPQMFGGPGASHALANFGGNMNFTSAGGAVFVGYDVTPFGLPGVNFFEGKVVTMGGDLNFTTQGPLTISDIFYSGGGNIAISSEGDIHQVTDNALGANGMLVSDGGNTSVTSGGEYTMDDGSIIYANTGNVNVNTQGNMSITGVIGNTIQLTSQNGSVLDNGDSMPDVMGNALAVSTNGANSSIGTASNALDTMVSNVAMANQGSGVINMANQGGNPLTVTNVGSVNGITNNGGNVNVSNDADLNVNSTVNTNGGNLAVESTQADVNVNANMASAGGNVAVTAQNNVNMQPVVVSSSGGTIDVTATTGNATITGLNSSNGTSGGDVRVMAMQGEIRDAGDSPITAPTVDGGTFNPDIWTGSEENQAGQIWLASSGFQQGSTQTFGASGNNYVGKTEAGVGTSGANGALEIFSATPPVPPPPPPPPPPPIEPPPVPPPCPNCIIGIIPTPEDKVTSDRQCLSIQVNNYENIEEAASGPQQAITPGVAVDASGHVMPGVIQEASYAQSAGLPKASEQAPVIDREECVCCTEPYLYE